METETALVILVIAPLFVLWVVALFHIVMRRPDLSVVGKGIWSAIVIVAGYAGLLLYAMFRPPRPVTGIGVDDGTAVSSALHRLKRLIEDHESGSITDEEFARDKAAVFGLEMATT